MSTWNLQLRNSSYTTDNVEILIRQLKAYCSDKLDIGRLCLGREGKENYLELNIARRVETDVGVWKKLTEDTVNESSEDDEGYCIDEGFFDGGGSSDDDRLYGDNYFGRDRGFGSFSWYDTRGEDEYF